MKENIQSYLKSQQFPYNIDFGDRKLSKIQKFHKNLNPTYYVKDIDRIVNLVNKKIDDFNILVFLMIWN